MDLYRLRVGLHDKPGRLARMATAFGELGINILEVDLHSGSGGARIDDMLVDLTRPLDLRAIELAVLASGGDLVDLAPADEHELTDPVTRALEIAAAAVSATTLDRFVQLVASLVRADEAWIVPGVDPDGAALPPGGRVDDLVAAASLAIPVGTRSTPATLHLRRRTPPFTFTEAARLRALVSMTVAPLERSAVLGLQDGGSVEIRPLGPEDTPAVERMHARCSDASLTQRYFAGPGSQQRVASSTLVADGNRCVLGALMGTEIIGIAHLDIDEAASRAEISLLVEDAHQRRGVATALLHNAAERLQGRSVSRLEALSLPDNAAVEALGRSIGVAPTIRREAGLTRALFDLHHGVPSSGN